MNQQLILQPVAVLMLLTALVWLLMYVRRLSYILKNNIDPQSIATPEAMNSIIPAHIHGASNNLKNLFELPVIFYALCALLLLTQMVTVTDLYCAWAFVILRIVHSVIHCTVNIVNMRFAAYLLSSLVLWYMVINFACRAF